ncbi:hypothetical protein P152DRAFT_462792 [Eremomyces bilateralis CBS 781.70]|uniref:PPP4R2-domain-containing protein n=1 Tax=Eremomyces bilateralis CBS 781.70 TaxID=1392243 RepID=A0A6G1FR16_9PEZI|nr:uncharacterized protein P152DRAFT_462792 [Eremomyces bilateralis CBS 781.70]KAF1808217.1 hypothetical protein P152DRAFT_462792 [Eremomyces bilateralis CBS 781.70]
MAAPDLSSQATTDLTILPSELHNLYFSIRRTLTTAFWKYPPHTIQRLAELLLKPRAHYRYLPSYLRALERVVCVSSNTTVFPLPQASLPNSSGTLLNGTTNSTSSAAALGSDESLGGALLTPIPWLNADESPSGSSSHSGSQNTELKSESTEIVDGPNGAGRIETVSVVNGVLTTGNGGQTNGGTGTGTEHELRAAGGVTQGELLRQEQEAGVVPSNAAYVRAGGAIVAEAEENRERDSASPEEQPHARGPEEVGMQDTGPQDGREGLDIEAAVGRRTRPAQEGQGEQGETQAKEGGEASGDTAADADAALASDESMKDVSDYR